MTIQRVNDFYYWWIMQKKCVRDLYIWAVLLSLLGFFSSMVIFWKLRHYSFLYDMKDDERITDNVKYYMLVLSTFRIVWLLTLGFFIITLIFYALCRTRIFWEIPLFITLICYLALTLLFLAYIALVDSDETEKGNEAACFVIEYLDFAVNGERNITDYCHNFGEYCIWVLSFGFLSVGFICDVLTFICTKN